MNKDDPPTLLIVGMANSIHVARWLELLSDETLKVVLFTSNASRGVHPIIQNLLQGSPNQKMVLTVPWFITKFAVPIWLLDKIFNDILRGLLILLSIKKHKPTFVHVLELQNAGYPTSQAYTLLGKSAKPPLYITNYGSDVYWYQKFPRHVRKLKKLLHHAEAFSAECERDNKIAKELGFEKKIFPAIAVTGGIQIEKIITPENRTVFNSRRKIIIKGYQGKWGQALAALDALEGVSRDVLNGFDIEIFSSEPVTTSRAKKFSEETGVNVICHPKNSLPHSKVLEMMTKARLYIGLSKSDGISTSMLEAMAMGAIPIQTNTSCANEWLMEGKSGHIADLKELRAISEWIEQFITNDELCLFAQASNIETIKRKYTQPFIRNNVLRNYKYMLTLGSRDDK